MRYTRLAALPLAVLVCASAEPALAKEWTTVQVSPVPTKLVAGRPWRATIVIAEHGAIPAGGLTPTVRVDNGQGLTQTFAARPSGPVGTYVAAVSFPTPGQWELRVADGITDAAAYRIRGLMAAAPPDPPHGFPWPQVVMCSIVASLFLAAWIACRGLDAEPQAPRRRLPVSIPRGPRAIP